MKFRDRAFEKRLWQLVKQELRNSPLLKKEYKRNRRTWTRRISGVFFFIFVPLILLGNLAGATGNAAPDALLIGLTLLLISAASMMAGGFILSLYWSPELYVITHFPVNDHDCFDHIRRRLLKNSLWALYLIALTYVWIGSQHSFNQNQYVQALGLALIHWGTLLAFASALIRFAPNLPYGQITTVSFMAFIAMMFLHDVVIKWADYLWPILAISPSGWINFAFARIVAENNSVMLWFAMPAILLLPFCTRLLDPLRESFVTGDRMFGETVTAESFQNDIKMALQHTEEQEESIALEEWKTLPWHERGWIEHLVSKWLSGKENVLLEILTAYQIDWTKNWTKALVTAVFAVLVPWVVPAQWQWAGIVLMAVATMMACPVFGGNWAGAFRNMAWITVTCPVHAFYPVDYRESTRTMWKTNLLRLAGWTPVFLISGAILGWNLAFKPLNGALVAGLILSIIIALQPVWLGWRFLGASNVTWHTFIRIPILLITLPLMITLVIFIFLKPFSWTGLFCLIGMFLIPAFVWWVDGQVYNKFRMDLVNPIREQL